MRARSSGTLRIAIDTGGTFTDCIWIDRGRIHMLKIFSTPEDPSRAIAEALQQIGVRNSLVLLHGTTVGTNTLIQRKGARVALVTTSGFEDAIEIGRQARPKLYDFFFDRVEPLVPSALRFGVDERTDCDGKVLELPSSDHLAVVANRIKKAAPQAIAISLLFSFANPANEVAVAKALTPLGVPLSVSHQILPEFREYERTSTVVVNAYLQPVMQTYLENLDRRAQHASTPDKIGRKERSNSKSARNRVFVMQSSGGITAIDAAIREPVRTVLSGPAGGIVGAAEMARRSGFVRVISFDMGGTSTDVSLVDREIHTGSQTEVAGLPVGVPMLDIHTVGAGGGSIARFDAAGALRVGPQSAGADPGPICYGRGTLPTVTDANLLLGRLRPDRFLGGNFVLDLPRTRALVSEWLTRQNVRMSLQDFASGVVRVINSTMEKAVRVVSIERGYDPREFALVAFGGAGGLHACELAAALGIPRVIVPALPGALSAFGILVSDVVKDYSRTLLWTASASKSAHLDKEFASLSRNAADNFRQEGWKGTIHFARSVDMRYRGQGYELNVPYAAGFVRTFHREHARRYGYSHPERDVEIVTIRLRASVHSSAPRAKIPEPRAPKAQSAAAHAPILFARRDTKTAIYDRQQLVRAKKYSGPAIVTEYSATTAVPPGMKFWLDSASNLIIAIK
jgi:N-methylhydantoinase A